MIALTADLARSRIDPPARQARARRFPAEYPETGPRLVCTRLSAAFSSPRWRKKDWPRRAQRLSPAQPKDPHACRLGKVAGSFHGE